MPQILPYPPSARHSHLQGFQLLPVKLTFTICEQLWQLSFVNIDPNQPFPPFLPPFRPPFLPPLEPFLCPFLAPFFKPFLSPYLRPFF